MKKQEFEQICGTGVMEEVSITRGENDEGYGIVFRFYESDLGRSVKFSYWVPIDRPYKYENNLMPEWCVEAQLELLVKFLLDGTSLSIYKEMSPGKEENGTDISIDGGLKFVPTDNNEPIAFLLGPAWQRIV
ncbi:MAG: hypothetical protein IKP65_06725 [Alphaproteobacteria bacterium]|nr:hypothetical protein [Alphaproteobacteria bacterium]